jgi:hypothetical protein
MHAVPHFGTWCRGGTFLHIPQTRVAVRVVAAHAFLESAPLSEATPGFRLRVGWLVELTYEIGDRRTAFRVTFL